MNRSGLCAQLEKMTDIIPPFASSRLVCFGAFYKNAWMCFIFHHSGSGIVAANYPISYTLYELFGNGSVLP